MTVMPLEWVLGHDKVDNIPPRRPISSQNSQTNNDVPPALEGLPSMNVEGLYRYLETLAGLVECQARAMRLKLLDNPNLLRVAHLMTLRS
ncbi:hypothetical protein CK203_019352 [Vitis vinifera]|uniref:Uncharacterized protein n=1 Tax=Vitis vinifera TaxID=29760 RepID=A0A438IYS4_VITVI|nr:hypothetical protein CK203_019352 [Vitis vinifera]